MFFERRGVVIVWMRSSVIPAALLAAVLVGCERTPVHVIRVENGPVESAVTSVEAGVVEPLRKAVLAPPVSGRSRGSTARRVTG